MIRNNFLTRFIVVTLTTALLLMMGSRAISVSALADPVVESLAPVFDTQIYQLTDYVETLPTNQLDIMYILTGALGACYFGLAEGALDDPYDIEDGAEGWLKSTGIQIYNSLVKLGVIGIDPITGIDYNKTLSPLLNTCIAAAYESSHYENFDAFNQALANRDDYFINITPDIMSALNVLFQVNGGYYEWQYTEGNYTSNFHWRTYDMTPIQQSGYNDRLAEISLPRAMCNSSYGNYYNAITTQYGTYSLFIDTDNYYLQLYDSLGQPMRDTRYGVGDLLTSSWFPSSEVFGLNTFRVNAYFGTKSFVAANFENYAEVAQYGYDNFNNLFYMRDQTYSYYYYFDPLAFITDVYYGVDWTNKHPVTNISDLNLSENNLQYYNNVTKQYLFDLKGYLGDLLNTTDLYLPFINNIYDELGNLVTSVDLIRVSTDIMNLINTINPPLPVNMNDIAELTDNTYLERVKEHARNAGDIFANYVAFWHNCDSDLVYTLFGAGILVLVGAFVGKWGHS